jgi:hypothetical protein
MPTTLNSIPPALDGLERVDGHGFPVLAGAGARTHAEVVAARCRRALDWLAGTFGERPAFTLAVVGPADWERVALVPIYGMPHVFGGLLVTGLEPAGFWAQYTRALWEDLAPAARRELTDVYGDPPQLGERFADLVVAHELTHLFHGYDEQTGLTDFPRPWLAELFANVGLHGHVATGEPDRLPALETICRLTWDAPAGRWPERSLDRIGASLAAGPLNYVWFQLRLLVVAGAIWRSGGAAALRAFRDTLRGAVLTDEEITSRIQDIAPEAAQALRDWPV